MKKLFDVYQDGRWIGAQLAENKAEALTELLGYETAQEALDNGYTAAPAINTRICSDGTSV